MKSNWKNTLLNRNQTIRDSLNVINSEILLKTAIVVDDNGSLVGVVTDGDIRRGLLNNLTLSDSVSQIMNSNPVTALAGTDKKILKAIMLEKGIFSIPVLDDNRKIIAVESFHDTVISPSFENPVFIMAGGFGTRLKPLTDNCPKPLLNVGGKPLLETVLLNFANSGFRNFYISTHFLPELIMDYFGSGEKWNVSISYIHEEEPLDTGGALGLLPKELSDEPIIVMNGDVLTTVNFHQLMEFHISNNADATMCVRDFDYQVPYGVVMGKGHNIINMVEKPTYRFFINAGIYIINPSIFRSVQPNQRIDMPTLFEQRIARGDKILMFPIHEYWLDIGNEKDYKRAQIDYGSLSFSG